MKNLQLAVKAGALYFALVFAAGFILGIIRTVWVVPRLGTPWAEILEAPFMVLISFLAACWVVRRLSLPPSLRLRIAVGLIGLIFMLLAEFSFALWIRGLAFREYWSQRHPLATSVYFAALVLFALMPAFVQPTQPDQRGVITVTV